MAAASLDRSRPLWAQTTASTPPAQTPTWTPVFTPVRRNIGYFTGRGGTIGYLINADGVLVVDSQYPDSAKAFLEGLAERTNHRPVDVLVNTHHHADHTGGNPAFKGVTKTIVAQTRVPALQKQANDVSTTPAEQVYADATFDELWNHVVGDERVHARTFTPAHTGGDIVVYFERANIVHVGDLVWNSLQTFVDRPGGASAVNWIPVCERIASTYPKDAIYLCGHAKKDLPVVLAQADVLAMRDYLTALVEHVRHEMGAGKSRDEIVSSTAPLAGFEARGPLTKRALEGTYDELASR
jgi:glyoxylase-like metal-dependent hydrolase (beta-lactamase superfamily II)